ncbi:MAG: alpha/beta hydrolase [Myxococcaceae bacterium]|jgi:pimeloyl-ACP methyl ester carboxylesterase|nr:alpha/beta hydrolase [Myxococcaceae bacterium]MCA3015997.1 alpha/beta hydrolase [Myxococcaceae bacterium]
MAIHFRDSGEGEPVVLIHGLGASHRVFDGVIGEGGERHRFVAVDLPRSGRSKTWAENTPEAIAEALDPFLANRGLTHFRLFGHSFGGLVALAFAARFPQRVASLTVASAPALGLPPEARLFLESPMAPLSSMWMTATPLLRPVVRSYLKWLWGQPQQFRDETVEHYLESLGAEGFLSGMIDSLRAVGRFRLPLEPLTAAPFPRRVLWGDRDPLVSVIDGERLASALGADFRVLRDVGHCVPEEHPRGVLEAIREA